MKRIGRITVQAQRLVAWFATIALLFVCLLTAAPARALTDAELLTQFGSEGSDAGQLLRPNGMATSPVNGHLYVADNSNYRISEFTAWGKFVKAWGWGVADGSPELQSCGPEASPPTETCQAGLDGFGPGQFHYASGVEVDSSGNIYVAEATSETLTEGPVHNFRVQKFGPSGNFLLMFGGGVNQGPTNSGNLCTASHLIEGDICGVGQKGSDEGEFDVGLFGRARDVIAIGPGNSVYVADKGRFQKFNSGGIYQSQIAMPKLKETLPESEGGGEIDVDTPGALATDPASGDLYFSFSQPGESGGSGRVGNRPDVYRLDASGGIVRKLSAQIPDRIVVDPSGNVFVLDRYDGGVVSGDLAHPDQLLEFNPAGNQTSKLCTPERVLTPGNGETDQRILAVATNDNGNVYCAFGPQGATTPETYIRAYGPAPVAYEPAPLVPPQIADQYAASVDNSGAVLRGRINPNFWTDTTYLVEYGVGKCSEGGCTSQQPPGPASKLTSKVTNLPVTSAGVFLNDLAPDTTYHYRFVAAGTGSGGEPVRGVGGKPGEDGAEGTFTTLPDPLPVSTTCPNQALRSGPSALLPDCRAYELVSPLEKNGSDILALPDISGTPNTLAQSATDGDRLTFSVYGSFAGSESAPFTGQYMARRGGAGWTTAPISPPRGESFYSTNTSLQHEFKSFSADLTFSWLRHDSEPQLAAGAIAGYANLYRRNNEDGSYEALCSVAPPHQSPGDFKPEIQGMSADGSHFVFRAEDNLVPAAPVGGAAQLYECSGGQLRLVSVLPNGTAHKGSSSAGGVGPIQGWTNVTNAVSANGSRIFWSDAGGAPGKIYVRVNGTATVPVSSPESPAAAAQFWTAAVDGSKAVYSFVNGGKEGNLYLFDVASKTTTPIAGQSLGVLGASADASRIYFASRQALDTGAVAGLVNLYLFQAGTTNYIGELSEEDLSAANLSPMSPIARLRTARVSPDGKTLAFTSKASMTGFNSSDVASREIDTEVFIYDAEEDELRCVSCNRSGVRPSGAKVAVPQAGNGIFAHIAAFIPPSQTPFHGARALSEDGSRLLFTSYDALVLSDTNGVADVYQWEEPGAGDCTQSSPTFSPPNGGCVNLISSGKSATDSQLLDASPDGDDVFFSTLAGLVDGDPGLIDIYNARADGGFAAPTNPAACEGEACQSTPAPPDDPTPASSSFQGAGNVVESKARKPRCRKGKVRRRGRCVTKGKTRGKGASARSNKGRAGK